MALMISDLHHLPRRMEAYRGAQLGPVGAVLTPPCAQSRRGRRAIGMRGRARTCTRFTRSPPTLRPERARHVRAFASAGSAVRCLAFRLAFAAGLTPPHARDAQVTSRPGVRSLRSFRFTA